MQELERGDSGVRSFASVQGALVMYPIYAFGSEEQKRHYLPKMAKGEIIGCFGLTEPDYGSNPSRHDHDGHASRRTAAGCSTARRCGSPTARTAHVAVVWAKTNGDPSDKSIRGFIVPTDTQGFTAKDQKGKLSLRASRHERARVPGRAPAGRRDPARSRAGSRARSCASRRRATASRGARSAPRWRASRKRSRTRRTA